MAPALLRGYFPIMATPYTEDNQVDLASVRRLVDFLVRNGAQGMSPNGGDSESGHLTPDERRRILEAVVEANGGRTPVLAGTTGHTLEESLQLNRDAQAVGASAVFAMPAWDSGAYTDDQVIAYYGEICQVLEIPIMIHGTRNMDVPLIARLVDRYPGVRYVKEETSHGPKLRRYTRELGDRVDVFGPGLHYPGELGWGALGVMPSCCAPHLHGRIFDAWRAGRQAEARALWNQLLPLVFWRWHTAAGEAGKVYLKHVGVFGTARTRPEFEVLKLDEADRQEMLRILEGMEAAV
ncbi:MAG: dihydrodipicolinate synthase family protein [Gemmatimonadota bacterium]